MTYSDEPKSSPAMPLFLLGQADASISFLRLLPESVATKATSVLAFRLLDSLWQQYRIDCRINHGRTLLSVDNGYELRVFATLIDELATWPPLLDANAVIRTHAPALLADEARLFENECEVRRDIVTEICDQIGCFPAGLDPIKASGLLIDRCQKLEEQHEFGICWALNLLGANRLDVLGRSKSCPPSLPCSGVRCSALIAPGHGVRMPCVMPWQRQLIMCRHSCLPVSMRYRHSHLLFPLCGGIPDSS